MRDTIQEIVRIEATVGRTGSGSSSACLRVDLACILGFPKGSACHRACSASQHLLSCSRIKGSARGVIEPPAATKTTPHRKWQPWDTAFCLFRRAPEETWSDPAHSGWGRPHPGLRAMVPDRHAAKRQAQLGGLSAACAAQVDRDGERYGAVHACPGSALAARWGRARHRRGWPPPSMTDGTGWSKPGNGAHCAGMGGGACPANATNPMRSRASSAAAGPEVGVQRPVQVVREERSTTAS